MTAVLPGIPCEICGPENECSCPPCACVWCRVRRGDGSAQDRAYVDSHVRAHNMARIRRDLHASFAAMQAKIDAELGRKG